MFEGEAATARTTLPRVPKVGRALHQPFIVLTGLSGSGKSQAIRALEDLGYFCVDNLPTTLIPTLAKLSLRDGGVEKVAIVVDVRERNFLSQFPRILQPAPDHARPESGADFSRSQRYGARSTIQRNAASASRWRAVGR